MRPGYAANCAIAFAASVAGVPTADGAIRRIDGSSITQFTIGGLPAARTYSGFEPPPVASAGDVNGDGLTDSVVGHPDAASHPSDPSIS